jgi:hypothetical protein
MPRRPLVVPALVAVLALVPLPLAAQRPLRVTGAQGITFGTLLPGVPSTVSPADPARGARFDITGAKDTRVEIVLVLPAVLAGPAATMPLSFSAASAAFSQSGTAVGMMLFDPRLPYTGTLSGNGRASVFLGATVAPGGAQRAGAYSNVVTITVAGLSI